MAKQASLSVTVDASRAVQRIDTFQRELRARLTAEWMAVVQACIEDVASRAPDPYMEYEYIQGYQGGHFWDTNGPSPLVGHRGLSVRGGHSTSWGHGHNSAQGSGDRISFIRTPGMWLKELLMLPANSLGSPNIAAPESFEMALGVVPILELGSRFSWQNFSYSGGEQLHTSPYGMWSFFEEGKTRGQIAQHGIYKLKPFEDKPWYWVTEKAYPQLRMYGRFDTAVFRTAVEEVIRSVQF